MSNGLSQAEIDALLSGGVPADTAEPPQEAASEPGGAAADPGRMLSQEEIEAMLSQAESAQASAPEPQDDGNRMLSQDEIAAMLNSELSTAEDTVPVLPAEEEDEPLDYSNLITNTEIDALGEIGNISMGTAATTLFALLNHRVDITTPRVSITTMDKLSKQYPMPFVSVEVEYTQGLEGTNCLFLQEKDVKIITDLMLGGDGSNISGELTEMHLSCISEVMNQMVGASSTSLSQMLKKPIDISPPHAERASLGNSDLRYPFTQRTTPIICTSFDMVVEGLINSEIMQITNIEFGKEMVKNLMGMSEPEPAPAPAPMPQEKSISEATHYTSPFADMSPAVPPPSPGAIPPDPAQPYPYPPAPYPPQAQQPYPPQPYPQQPPQPYPPQAYPPQPYPPQPYPYPPQPYPPYPPATQPAPQPSAPPVDVRPASFANFGDSAVSGALGENMDLLMDVPLTVSVELGKSRKHIKEILDFNIGTLIVLDKMAGDMVDVVVNGKLIAQGEVVVVDDSYGCRITDIVSPSKRIITSK